jgi:hypothetical protein
LARGSGEERLAVGLALFQPPGKPQGVLLDAGPRLGLFAGDEPQSPGDRVELVQRHPVELAGPLPATTTPVSFEEHLQVPAEGRLRELDDVTELIHGQFVPLHQPQEADADRVRKRLQLGHKSILGRGLSGLGVHPLSRMK